MCRTVMLKCSISGVELVSLGYFKWDTHIPHVYSGVPSKKWQLDLTQVFDPKSS